MIIINAHIKLLNGDSVFVNDLESISHKGDRSSVEDAYPNFSFYANYFYNFIGKNKSLCVWGKDIHHVEFSNSKY